MQVEGTAATAHVAGSVRGLGVCDVLRVELVPVQRAGLEQGLAARVAELERRQAALGAVIRERTVATSEREQIGEVSERLRLLTRVQAGLPAPGSSTLVVFGPAALLLEVVDGCVAAAVSRAADCLDAAQGGPPQCASASAELEAAAAWIATALDCAAVDRFCFEPGTDPGRPW